MALATLVVDLILKAGGFESDLGRASKQAQKRAKEIEKSFKQLGVAVGTALAAGITAVGVAVKQAIDRMDDLHNAAKTVGMDTEGFSRLTYAAKLSNVSMEELQGGLGKLVRAQAAAVDSQSEQAAAFKALGVEFKDVTTGALRPAHDVLLDLADAFNKAGGSQESLAAMSKILGRGFQTMVPLLAEGSAGIREFEKESDALGATITNEAGAAADEFNDNLDKLKTAVTGAATTIAIQLMPDLLELSSNLVESSKEGGTLSRTVDYLSTALHYAGRAISLVTGFVRGLGLGFGHAITQGENLYSFLVKLRNFDFKGAADARNKAIRDYLTFDDQREEILQGDILGNRPRAAAPKGRGARAPDADMQKALQEYLEQADKDRQAQEGARAAAKAAAEAKREAAAAAREQAKADREAEEAAKKVKDAYEDFVHTAEDLADQRAGPMAQAQRQYDRDLKDLRDRAKEGKVADDLLAKAEANLRAEFEKTTKAVEERENPQRKLLDDLNAQLASLRMLSQEERDRAEFLREYTNATEEQADAYGRVTAEIRETQESIGAADQLRDHFADAFASILDGTKSAKEAFSDLATAILADIARMLARRWVEQLFGQYGTQMGGGAGGGGGFLGSVMSWLTGSAKGNAFNHGELTAFANGGVVTRPTLFPMARGMGLMGEAGPEAVMPLSRMANGKLGVAARGGPQINITVDGATTKETAQQIAMKVTQALAFAGRAQ